MFKERGTLPLDKIIPYERNPRVNDNAVPRVYNSIRDFGYIKEIEVNQDGVILSGHTRHKALLQLYEDGEFEKGRLKEQGITFDAIPVKILTFSSFDEEEMYRLADNKTAEGAGWDFDLLDDILSGLKETFDPADYGFDFDLWSDENIAEDEVVEKEQASKGKSSDESPAEGSVFPLSAFVEPGDVVRLGSHVLICEEPSKEAVNEFVGASFTSVASISFINSLPRVYEYLGYEAIVRVGDLEEQGSVEALNAILTSPIGVTDFLHWRHPVKEEGNEESYIRHAIDTFLLLGAIPAGDALNGGESEEPMLADVWKWAISSCVSENGTVLDLTGAERDMIAVCDAIGRRCVCFCPSESTCDCIASEYVETHGFDGCEVERGGETHPLKDVV